MHALWPAYNTAICTASAVMSGPLLAVLHVADILCTLSLRMTNSSAAMTQQDGSSSEPVGAVALTGWRKHQGGALSWCAAWGQREGCSGGAPGHCSVQLLSEAGCRTLKEVPASVQPVMMQRFLL